MEIELTDSLRLGLKVGIVAVEPVHAPMRFEVRLLQDAADAAGVLRPSHQDSTGWRDNNTWPVSWSPLPVPRRAQRGETRCGRPERGASCKPLKPCAR